MAQKITELLDESIVVDEESAAPIQENSETYQIIQRGKVWDLSKTNFEQLKKEFKDRPHPHIEITELRSFIEEKLQQMMQENSTRINFAEHLQRIINRYNAGASAVENTYDELVNFAQSMREEAERHTREGLTEDELEIFDLLKKDKLTQAETQQVKLAAKSLLQRLKAGQPKVLVQDWWKDTQSQKIVEAAIETVLDETLPDSYDRITFKDKCSRIFGLTLDFARQHRKWAS